MRWPLTALLTALLLTSACMEESPTVPVGEAKPDIPPTISPYEPDIDPADFVETIDNPYMPLEPGMKLVYEGGTKEESEVVTVTVTDRTKEVMGVTCTVVKDIAEVDGELQEKTFDWFAQDRYGNVWYFGEETEEYEDGKIDTAGSWEAGVDGALPGIVMLADPDIGDRYRQEYYEGEAEDMGEVLRLGVTLSVGDARFEDVLVTKDFTPLEPSAVEHKFYAPGVGVVRERAIRGDKAVLELVSRRD